MVQRRRMQFAPPMRIDPEGRIRPRAGPHV
jgi:hypothetical protein